MDQHFKHYSEKDRKFIRDNYQSMSNKAIGDAIGRTDASVTYQLVKMRLHRSNRKVWTRQELDKLRRLAPTNSDRALATHFDVSVTSIKCAIANHKIKTRRTGYFRKGHRPWNFMTKGLLKSTPGMKRTQFKKGQLPRNTKHDGAITVRLDHPKDRRGRPYKWIRVAIGKWVLYHRWVWEKKHGPVPRGSMVIFKDGDSLNTKLANLQLITMADNARRNYNPSKAQQATKGLSDNYIAGRFFAGGDKKLRKAFIHGAPELIAAQRTLLLTKRQIRNERQNKTQQTPQ
jgi:hypothetical protein